MTWGPPHSASRGCTNGFRSSATLFSTRATSRCRFRETQQPGDERKKYVRDIARVCATLYKAALASLEAGALPLVLGGDHSLAAGSVAASAEMARRADRPLGLIWVDAHGDMNTPSSSTSGNVHGMPLAALLGPEPTELSCIGGFSPKVSPEHTVLIGVRNLDAQREAARP